MRLLFCIVFSCLLLSIDGKGKGDREIYKVDEPEQEEDGEHYDWEDDEEYDLNIHPELYEFDDESGSVNPWEFMEGMETIERHEMIIKTLARQMMLNQLAVEERIRSEGSSGIKQTRVNHGGTRPYYTNHYSGRSIASIHEHANNVRTVGMGEFIGVLNGVEFRTRHNDYRLKQPHLTSPEYHQTQIVEFPEVPPAVLAKSSVEKQIDEMRLWFKAFKDQDYSVRDYRDYFKPVLCYLEGAWTIPGDSIDESFESDRHFLEAASWFDLQEKIRFTSYTGRKNTDENFAYLPTTIIELVNGTVPIFAQWNYRILCHPLKGDLPLNTLKPVDDLLPRFSQKQTFESYLETRAARFTINDQDESKAKFEKYNILDMMMAEIPGKDNYQGYIEDEALGSTAYEYNGDSILNSAYYHRYFKVKDKGAMGLNTRHRGFSDPNLFVALTSQENVAPMKFTNCKGNKKNKNCETLMQRVSYAIPLELIYLTPLSNWNPYKVEYKGEAGSPEAKSVRVDPITGQLRNGKNSPELAFDGVHSKLYYITPSAFFVSGKDGQDPADTTRNSVAVLDHEGVPQLMRASGTRIMFPEIEGVGVVRQRYPVMPVHGEGSAVWKEMEALKDALMDVQSYLGLYRVPPFGSISTPSPGGPPPPGGIPTTTPNPNQDITFHLSVSHAPQKVSSHSHTFEVPFDEFQEIRNHRKTRKFLTTEVNGHRHEVFLFWSNWKKSFVITKCDGMKRCWDMHDRAVTYDEP